MNKLAAVFGSAPYVPARRDLIWREVGSLTDAAFSRVIEKLIGEYRHAPMLPDFRDVIASERENSWRHEKKEHAQEARGFMIGRMTSTDDERQLMLHTIRERVKGNVNDADWKCFMDLINTRFTA